jgi:hypothetical protein
MPTSGLCAGGGVRAIKATLKHKLRARRPFDKMCHRWSLAASTSMKQSKSKARQLPT